MLALWWVLTRPGGQVVMLATREKQIEDVLWQQGLLAIKRLAIKNGRPIGGKFYASARHGFKLHGKQRIVGFPVEGHKIEALGGYSRTLGEGGAILFILDEASGLDEAIWEGVRGNMAGGGKLLATGNPLRTSGTFYDAFAEDREGWALYQTATWENPNCRQGATPIPGLSTLAWVEEMRAEYGEDSPVFQARVAGQFPAGAADAVIPLYAVEEAVERWPETKPERGRAISIGIDAARFGDDETVVQPVRRRYAYAAIPLRQADGIEIADAVCGWLREHRREHEPVDINIDCGGGFGDGAYSVLLARKNDRTPPAELSGEVQIRRINVAEQADTAEHHQLRDQLWFAAREWLLEGGAIPNDRKLRAELVAPIYKLTPTGKIKVESKDTLKPRLGRSPDRADALALAVYRSTREASPAVGKKAKPATRWSGFNAPRGF